MSGWRLAGFLAWLPLAAAAAELRAQPAPPPKAFVDAGLSRAGRYWICQEEADLRRLADETSKLEAAHAEANKRFRSLVGRYDELRGKLEKAQAEIDANTKTINQTALATTSTQQLQTTNTQLKDRIVKIEEELTRELNALDEKSPMTAAAVELVNARGALTFNLLSIRRRIAQLPDRYRELAEDERIAREVAELPGKETLGPVEAYESTYRVRLARLEKVVFTDGVPVYRRSKQYRIGLVLNETTPATFTYTGALGPTLVPTSMLQGASVAIPDDAPQETIAEGNRQFAARKVVLPTLRIGSLLLRNVEVLALPPEGEDLGARLSLSVLQGRPATLETRRLWLRVAANGK